MNCFPESGKNPQYDRAFPRLLDWCCGAGFLGFRMLEEGICEELCMVDINPRAIESVQNTITENRLARRVTCYAGENLRVIPPNEKFDLVVANPPGFYAINTQHPLGAVIPKDQRSVDEGWAARRGFYRGIREYLNPGALVLISEVQPYVATVRVPWFLPIAYDRRPQAPINEFHDMIVRGGLSFVGTERYCRRYGFEFWMVISRYDK